VAKPSPSCRELRLGVLLDFAGRNALHGKVVKPELRAPSLEEEMKIEAFFTSFPKAVLGSGPKTHS
jgi:hypothetical protein